MRQDDQQVYSDLNLAYCWLAQIPSIAEADWNVINNNLDFYFIF